MRKRFKSTLKIILNCIGVTAIVVPLLSGTQAVETRVFSNSTDYVNGPELFFEEILSTKNINTSRLKKDYPYCSPYTAYLVDKGYISAQKAYMVSSGDYSTSFLIDKGLMIVEYFDRPIDKGNYKSITERVAKETGIIEESFDFSKKLNNDEIKSISKKISNNDFTRIEYFKPESKIKYTIDNFQDKTSCLRKTLDLIDMIPENCIEEFNDRGLTLRIVEDIEEDGPIYNNTFTSAYINFTTKEMFITKGFERDMFHEFGHLMLDNISNKNTVYKKLYNTEGAKYNRTKNIKMLTNDLEEYYADIIGEFISRQDNSLYLQEFKLACPMTYRFIQNLLYNDSFKNKQTVNVNLLKEI